MMATEAENLGAPKDSSPLAAPQSVTQDVGAHQISSLLETSQDAAKNVGVPRDASLLAALRDVTDPEFPISIVDMGLVVDAKAHGSRADIKLTFTAMGCPAMEMIVDDVRERLLREPGVEEVAIEVVWEPIWTKDRLSEEAKWQLRAWGISL